MAAEVSMSRVVEYLKKKKKDDDKPQPVPVLMLHHDPSKESTPPPMTRDLLGLEFQSSSSQELVDLDTHVPSGWEKRLDLKSGKVYLQRCCSQALPSTSNRKHQPINSAPPQLQDLNFPPSPSILAFNGSDDAFLDLKLLTSSSPPTSCNYQSVCTLDKVKSALERADREPAKKRSPFWKSSSSSPPLHSSTSSSIKETREEDSNQEMSAIATCCPSCLLYVLISKTNPKCPRCNCAVPLPSSKKPRIDLNISI